MRLKKYLQILCCAGLSLLLACQSSPQTRSAEYGRLATPTADNSRNSLDWSGTYRGRLPCADCYGIRTELVLKGDGSFQLAQQYLGKSVEPVRQEGSFAWDATGSRIILNKDSSLQFLVGEGALHKLDLQGHRIEGALAAAYILAQKQPDQSVEDKYWQLVALPEQELKSVSGNRQQPHLELRATDHSAVGSGGCNRFTGTYRLDGAQLQFNPLTATEMYCLEGMEVEDVLFAALQACRRYQLDTSGDTLMLWDEQGNRRASFYAQYLHP